MDEAIASSECGGSARRDPRGSRDPAARRAALAAILLTSALARGCLSYSPHEVPFGGRNLRIENLARLESRPPAARLRFAVVGDVQRAFDDAWDAVVRLNQIDDLAFVVQIGDFTDLGRAEEFERMAEVFAALEAPWLVVVGNHDLLGNGGNIFEALFGPRNSAFTHQRTRFVLLDTNSREYGFGAGVPDLGWLAAQLAPGPDHDRTVVLSHVWPWSSDFDPGLRDAFVAQLGDAEVALSLHGHDHSYRAELHEGVPYFIADTVGNRSLLLVDERESGALEVERIWF
jgi:calcineurin-like phosphoesterase family protein